MTTAAPGTSPPQGTTTHEARRWDAASVAGALLLAVVVAWRARYGISFFDDGYYASITLRLAQGARPFADEMTAQTLGFLAPAAFATVWHAVFGMHGIVLALRLLYVVAAAVVGGLVYRALRPSYPPAACFFAASAPLIALPYNIIGLTYNTMALLAFLLAWALAFQAARGGSRMQAFAAGVAAAVGAISYPPLAVGAFALLATCAVMSETRKLVLPAMLGAGATLVVFAAWLFSAVSLSDVQAALAYSSGVLDDVLGPAQRVLLVAGRFTVSLVNVWLLPMWVCAAVASMPPRAGIRWTRTAALLIPLAAFAPSASALALSPLSPAPAFGALGGAYLIVLTAGLLVPVFVWTLREGGHEARLALVLALPLSLANTLATAYFTSAGWQWAVPVIGLAPLVAVLFAGWLRMCVGGSTALAPRVAASLTGVAVIAGLLTLLYATAFNDAPPRTLSRHLSEPAVTGIVTQREMADRISALAEAGRRWVEPDEGVLFVHGQLGYMLVEGRMVTNAVWLATGPSDAETLAYYERTDEWPDVVFVSLSLLRSLAGTSDGLSDDPLLSHIEAGYERVDEDGGFAIYRRR